MIATSIEQFAQDLSLARMVMLAKFPFWGSLLHHLRVVPTDKVPTAAVTADDRLLINPDFFHAIGEKRANGNTRRAFVLAHECAHPALGIFFRGAGHDPRTSNIAHDHVINLMLKADNTEWLVEGALCDERFADRSYEQVYHLLMQEREEQKQQGGKQQKAPKGGDGNDLFGGLGEDVMPSDFLPEEQGDEGADSKERAEMTEAEKEARARRWEQRVVEAYMNAKAQGRVGAGAERMFGQVGKHTVRWETKLHNKVSEIFSRIRLDWGNPARRYCATGIYAPSEQGRGLNCAVYMDTSGSISEANILAGMAEIERITKLTGGRIRLLEGDAEITSDKWVRKLPNRVTGGGGTSFVPVFEHLRGDRNVRALVVFTDTWGTMPDWKPPYRVIWAVYEHAAKGGVKVPFGDVIIIPEIAN